LEQLGARERALDFLARYGEKGYAVLRALLDAYYSSAGASPGVRLGDVSYREVAARLRERGLSYNPSMLLRVLEREYGLIETSYQSRNQHWWRIPEPEALEEALEEYEAGSSPDPGPGEEALDPEVELFRLQVASLDPAGLIERLDRLLAKPRLTRADAAELRRLAFGEMELVARLLRRAEELGYEGPEVELLREAMLKASRLARRLNAAARASRQSRETLLHPAGAQRRQPYT
jgi:hypothetical protein